VGVLKGAITYAKLYVEGELPDDAHQKYIARIRTRTFKPLTPEDEGEASVGWAPIERPFDDEISFRSDGVFFGSYLNLAMRIDKWKFPSALVKNKMAQAERAWKQRTGKEKMSRVEKTELRDLVERKLRREGIPVTKVIDFSWNIASGELRFFGRSKNALEYFYELFEKTFSMHLVPGAPYTVAKSLDLPRSLDADLASVEPTVFR